MGRPLYCLSIPKESIVEVYLGCASYRNVSHLGIEESLYINTRKEWQLSGAKVQIVHRKEGSWSLEVSDLKV